MTTTTTMMMEINGNDQRLYYLPCNFCTTILAVSVPCSNQLLMNNMVTIRCGRCSNMQTVNMGAMLPTAFLAVNPPPHLQQQQTNCTNSQLPEDQYMYSFQAHGGTGGGSSSSSSSKLEGGLSKTLISTTASASNKQKHPLADHDHKTNGLVMPNPPPEKRQRAPSAYNRFIKEEIRRIKSCNPDISHKEVFSMAAKNWAHFPHIQFGLALDATKQANLDSSLVGGRAPAMAQSYP